MRKRKGELTERDLRRREVLEQRRAERKKICGSEQSITNPTRRKLLVGLLGAGGAILAASYGAHNFFGDEPDNKISLYKTDDKKIEVFPAASLDALARDFQSRDYSHIPGINQNGALPDTRLFEAYKEEGRFVLLEEKKEPGGIVARLWLDKIDLPNLEGIVGARYREFIQFLFENQVRAIRRVNKLVYGPVREFSFVLRDLKRATSFNMTFHNSTEVWHNTPLWVKYFLSNKDSKTALLTSSLEHEVYHGNQNVVLDGNTKKVPTIWREVPAMFWEAGSLGTAYPPLTTELILTNLYAHLSFNAGKGSVVLDQTAFYQSSSDAAGDDYKPVTARALGYYTAFRVLDSAGERAFNLYAASMLHNPLASAQEFDRLNAQFGITLNRRGEPFTLDRAMQNLQRIVETKAYESVR